MFKNAMYLSRIRSAKWLADMRQALAIKRQYKRAYYYDTAYYIKRCFAQKPLDLFAWKMAVRSTRWSKEFKY